MGQMTSDEYVTMFLGLFIYIPYLKDEKVKIERFICGLPMLFRDKIQLLEPQTLNNVVKKLEHCYEKAWNKTETKSNWVTKRTTRENVSWSKGNPKVKARKHPYQTRQSQQKDSNVINGNVQQTTLPKPRIEGQEPLNCQTCGGNHGRIDCPHQQEIILKIYSAQEEIMVGEVSWIMPRVYATFNNHQENNQESIIEMEGEMQEKVVPIFIDIASNYSHVSQYLVEKWKLDKEPH